MRLISIFFGMALFLSACAQEPVIEANYDASQDFGTYQTFAWARDEPMDVLGLLGPTPRTAEKLLTGIRSNLESKGFAYTQDRSAADFLVQFTVGARDGVEVWNVPNDLSNRVWWGRSVYGTQSVAQTYTEGQLAIDIVDSASQIPVWHGAASKRMTPEELNNPDPNVQTIIDDVLSSFPPDS
ncbi:MAG: DUF4136 domain-containing protein [Paracoccaceae bacterium]